MSGRSIAACLIFAAISGLGWASPAASATPDCSLPIGQLTTAQFEACLRPGREPAKIIPLRIGDYGEPAPKPTTQRAYDALLHAGE